MPNYKHAAEAFISISDPDQVGRTMCLKFKALSLSVDFSDHDKLFEIGDGRAILSSVSSGLYLRVEAVDLATFLGIQTLVQIVLNFSTDETEIFLEWTPTIETLLRSSHRNAANCSCRTIQ
jgi:hypothetical protein